MGKHITPKYRVVVDVEPRSVALTPFAWNVKEAGKPNAANLAAFVARYNASFAAGGVNEHAGPLRIVGAVILRNDAEGGVVAGPLRTEAA